MSLESWKKEFYPVDACSMSDKNDNDWIEHSIKKWKGFTKDNLEKHTLKKLNNGASIFESECFSKRFIANYDSCALCVNHLLDSYDDRCVSCPIYQYCGRDCEIEFGRFYYNSNPNPMIELLEKTLKWVNENEEN